MATAVRDPLVGLVVDGRYQVLSRIAQGGMATVYLATDVRLERSVALKVMHPHLAHDPAFVERFSREARSAARLNHPGVVAVYDQGADSDAVYLTMELVPGGTLREVISERGALPLGEVLDVVEEVLDGLAAAHAVGLVHRDVKPENVLVGRDGRVRVADFGLARAATASATSASTLIGTVGYLAPELVLHGGADARGDVYAVGVVLFELLTGRQPFTGAAAVQVAFRHVHEDVPPPSCLRPGLPAAVDDLVAWATDRDPGQRPADAGQMLAGVRQVRQQLSDDDLDRPASGADGRDGLDGPDSPSRDGRTRVVARAGALALPAEDEAPEQGQTQVRRRRRPGRRTLVALLVALVLLGVAGGAVALREGPLARVTVPSVASSTQGGATLVLRQHHLLPTVEAGYSDDVAAGVVISTSPGGGASVRKDATVHVLVSRGPQLFAVPALAGQTLGQAQAAVTGAHLAVGTVASDWSETVPEGTVISQQTPQQPSLRRGAAVSFTVSKGREPISVPPVVGATQADATSEIIGAGLTLGAVTSEASDTVPSGQVVRSTPDGGATLHRGDAVALVVSSGPALVDVPDVTGQRVDDARRVLEAAGLKVSVNEVFGAFFGVVRGQDPAGGQLRRGATVTLTVV